MAITPLDRFLEYQMHLLKDSGQPRPFAAWRQDLITAALSAWFFGGLVLDTNAHAREWAEGFFTWWHLAFYTGFLATAAWIAYLMYRAHRGDGRTGKAAVPHGYGPAVIGAPLFIVSGLGDMLWHQLLGVEESLDILFSPSHLGLAVGGILVVLAPWLSAWRRAGLGAEPEPVSPFVRFAAPALSLGFAFGAVVLFLGYLVAFAQTPLETALALRGPEFASFPVAAIMFTTVAVLALVLIVTGRFGVPPGFFTVAFAYPAIMAAASEGFANDGYAWLFLASGAWADFLTWLVRPDLRRRRDLITFAAGWAVPVWAAYFIVTGGATGIWPAPEIGLGAPIVAALVGTAFMLVVQPDRGGSVSAESSEPSPFDDVMARAKAMTRNRGGDTG
ncbi:hypothetical protein [Glycomyces xiaoerkulensis]|uniref:hypothetical protein n=1 Tax=Glycomyces xiaoerkulensis TaxID=2038139 RepID=UPI000C268C55|nr:hypothetical protein [Glycomyces xiaoerkulensis]